MSVGRWSVVLMLLVVVPLGSTDNNSTYDSQNPDKEEKVVKVTKKAVLAVIVVLLVMAVLVVGVVVPALGYRVRQRRQRRSSPLYLGSCRRLNTIHLERVNVGLRALERAPALHHTHQHQPTPSGQREEGEVERGGNRWDQEEREMVRCTGVPSPTAVARTLEKPGSRGPINRDRNRGLSYHDSREEREDMYGSYCELTHIGSLSRTYTFPNVQPDRERSCSYYTSDLNSYYTGDLNDRRHWSTRGSAPCLTASYFQPLPIPEEEEEEEEGKGAQEGEEEGEEEEVCPLPVVQAHESPTYMHLNPLTMEEASHYESLVRVGPGGGGGGERKGMPGSVVATSLGRGRRKPPPRLISGKDRPHTLRKIVGLVDRHCQSLPTPTEREGERERNSGHSLNHSSVVTS